MKKYWFYIEHYVHLNCIHHKKVLLYNTLNEHILVYNNSKIYSFIELLNSSPNNGILKVELKSLEEKNIDIYRFILDVRKEFMGDLLPISESNRPPVLFRSRPMVLKEGRIYQDRGENILYNLTKLSFYINGICNFNCSECSSYYKQFQCCHKGSEKELSVNVIADCIKNAQESSLLTVNILGGNIFDYSHFQVLVETLNSYPFKKVYKANIKHALKESLLRYILRNPNNCLELICTDITDLEKIYLTYNKCQSKNISFNIIIQSLNEQTCVEEIFKENLPSINLIPFYNGRNLVFFEENVFMEEDDLRNISLNDVEIKRNSILNNHFFGHLICMNDGNIYSSLNENSLGNIREDTLEAIMYKELIKDDCWLQVRSSVEPCNNCLYSHLCPPISDYEKVLKRNNLCHVKI